ncbi:MAG TPA: 2Fe-2S iron-sulfur cluster-binding protein [Thermoanaerobaculia bacterium]|jgi:NADH-quinone oxidoreductase subunit G|nr:2Fe-2S iron-sulfur cluster-binding protein [Thermoanaerobaculia bacterium]HEV8608893.1 2Fe-2S iron-sulfur cluster-binding protein [Thermoanaerobaculia bacterium]
MSTPAAPAAPPPPPPGAEKKTITIVFDGKPFEVPPGINLIEAAKLAGIEIPHFCFHPRMSVVGQCRMCLVEIEGIPKIQAACTTPLKEGLIVKTTTEKVRDSRAANMEFLLINHPLDCPICDQAGECTLQDNAFGYGEQRSRYDERKRQYAGFDRTMIGPHVIADMTRCIQCTRCIRFCSEIAGTGELTFLDRGGRTLVWTHDGEPLANDWSACAADVCPVGALTTKEFRFRRRVWELEKTPSVCPGCNIGCNISIESRDRIVYRFLPRLNPAVNDYWLCDYGRFRSEPMNERDVTRVTSREGSEVKETTVPAAIERLATEIRKIIDSRGPSELFFLGSAHLSNEENFLLRKLADYLACGNRDVVVDKSRVRRMKSKTEWIEGDHFGANYAGAVDMGLTPGAGGHGLADVLEGRWTPDLVLVADAGFAAAADDPEAVARLRGAKFLVAAARTANALTRAADVVLPAASLAQKEGSFTNVQGRVQRFDRAFLPPPPARAHWELLLMLAAALGWGDRNWTPTDIRGLIRGEVEGYGDVTEEELAGGGLMKKGLFVSTGAI